MKYIGIFVALVALIGVTVGLNPQPEPPMPANVLDELGRLTVNGDTVTIDLGTIAPDAVQANVDFAINVLVDMAGKGQLDHGTYVIEVNNKALTFAREKLKSTSKTTGDFNLERTKKTDHLGTYHFKNLRPN